MLRTYEWADPMLSVQRYRRRAATARRLLDKAEAEWMVGPHAILHANAGPQTRAIVERHPDYRRIEALYAEAALWEGCARRLLALHDAENQKRTPWKAPRVHDPEIPTEVEA